MSVSALVLAGCGLWLGYVLIKLGPRLRDRVDVAAGAVTAAG